MISLINKTKHFIWRCYDTARLNSYWFFFIHFRKKPKVLSDEKTIRLIVENDLSVSRYGDGEFRLMSKRGDIGFQSANDLLSQKLNDSFSARNKNLLVCSYNFSKKRPMNTKSGVWLKKFVFRNYKYFHFFDFSYLYGDTDFTRFYQPDCYKNTDYDYLRNKYIPLLQKIWNQKKLLIVEGAQTKLGVGNDLFSNASSIRRIICPPENAFDFYDEILESIIENREPEDLVLVSLGPTASVLTTDLCINHGIRAIDIGHIDVVYLWFINKVKSKTKISGKYVNEVNNNDKADEITYSVDFEYQKQIIQEIKSNEQ